jgi:hypothetical protein
VRTYGKSVPARRCDMVSPVLRMQEPVLFCPFLAPEFGDRDPGWKKIRIRDEYPESYFLGFKSEFFDPDPDPASGIFLTLDPGSWMEKFGSGIRKV